MHLEHILQNNKMQAALKSGFFDNICTPLWKIDDGIFAKLECCQATGSVKDRFVFEAVKKAIAENKITNKTQLIEATSGNTGISLAAAGAALGLQTKIIMPENMSDERKQMMRRFGAEIVEVGPSDFQAAIALRNELVQKSDSYWSPMQFENQYNIEIHEKITGPEINGDLERLAVFEWDFLSGSGTGGTLMGLQKYFSKNKNDKNFVSRRVIQVSPKENASSHGIQGINDGQDFLLDKNLMHTEILVSTVSAKQEAQNFAKTHGVLIGISAGANISAAKKYRSENPNRNVVTLLCDRGERYFSNL